MKGLMFRAWEFTDLSPVSLGTPSFHDIHLDLKLQTISKKDMYVPFYVVHPLQRLVFSLAPHVPSPFLHLCSLVGSAAWNFFLPSHTYLNPT